jgi:phosphoglycerate dehydrogenase-like enzyme
MRAAIPIRFRDDLDALDSFPADLDVAWYTDGEDLPSVTPGCEVVWLGWSGPAMMKALEAADSLRWVFTHGAGVESLPLDHLRERGIVLTNGSGIGAVPIAEYVVMAMLAAAKDLPALVRAQDRAEWLSRPPGFGELYGSRALIVGYGSIGRAIGDRLRGFGVDVTGVRRRPSEEPDVLGGDEWRGRLGEFDWVVLCTPLTGESRHQIGARELGAMKPGSWILNISRGSLIDQDALIAALEGGGVGGAYLDVTDPEPLPADSPLWRMPNVIVSPHSSWASRRFERRASELFLDNLTRYREGQPLRNVVDLESGY